MHLLPVGSLSPHGSWAGCRSTRPCGSWAHRRRRALARRRWAAAAPRRCHRRPAPAGSAAPRQPHPTRRWPLRRQQTSRPELAARCGRHNSLFAAACWSVYGQNVVLPSKGSVPITNHRMCFMIDWATSPSYIAPLLQGKCNLQCRQCACTWAGPISSSTQA